MVSGHPKSTGIPWVDGLSTGPSDLGCHIDNIAFADFPLLGAYSKQTSHMG